MKEEQQSLLNEEGELVIAVENRNLEEKYQDLLKEIEEKSKIMTESVDEKTKGATEIEDKMTE